MKHFFTILIILFFASNAFSQAELGTKENPIKLYITPSTDINAIASSSNLFMQFLEKETGYFFKSGITKNYIAVVEAFGSNRADIAVINSFGYLLANSKYGAVARLRNVRRGKDTYFGAIMVSEKSQIKKLSDLNGKRFAFTDAASTSGYLFPLKILNENKIKIKNFVFAGTHDNVITKIYQGQVDAGGAFYVDPIEGKIQDARLKVITQYPDVEQKVKVLQITDPIPNDPFIFRKNLPEDISVKFIKAINKFLTTEEGKAAYKTIFLFDGVVSATDQDYDFLRKVLKSTNTDAAQLVK
jgi:phosphonate transport system substrate-binding protein